MDSEVETMKVSPDGWHPIHSGGLNRVVNQICASRGPERNDWNDGIDRESVGRQSKQMCSRFPLAGSCAGGH